MHWSEELARQVIERNPDKEEYICAAGISPSGSVHIGNFRDVATSYFVVRALRKLGRQARLLFSWDEYDRMRKVPANVAAVAPDFEKYIGTPYISVPNPFCSGAPNYAAHFEREFEEAMELFGIEMDYRFQASMYREGRYTDRIIHALRHRFEIFDILDAFRTQDAEEGSARTIIRLAYSALPVGATAQKSPRFPGTAQRRPTPANADMGVSLTFSMSTTASWPGR